MSLRITYFKILLLLAIFLGTPTTQAQILKQTFSETAAEFEISVPNNDWLFEPRSLTPGSLRATIRFKSPINQFVPNVTVRVNLIPQKEITLDRLIQEDLKDLPSRVKVAKKEKFKHKGNAGYRLTFIDPQLQVTFFQWIFLKEGKSFVVTAAAKTSSLPRLKEDLEKILNSFKLL